MGFIGIIRIGSGRRVAIVDEELQGIDRVFAGIDPKGGIRIHADGEGMRLASGDEEFLAILEIGASARDAFILVKREEPIVYGVRPRVAIRFVEVAGVNPESQGGSFVVAHSETNTFAQGAFDAANDPRPVGVRKDVGVANIAIDA